MTAKPMSIYRIAVTMEEDSEIMLAYSPENDNWELDGREYSNDDMTAIINVVQDLQHYQKVREERHRERPRLQKIGEPTDA